MGISVFMSNVSMRDVCEDSEQLLRESRWPASARGTKKNESPDGKVDDDCCPHASCLPGDLGTSRLGK
jgi:hypothetical protein